MIIIFWMYTLVKRLHHMSVNLQFFLYAIGKYIFIHGPRSSYKKSWVLQECSISPQRLISKPDLWGPKFGKTCPYINQFHDAVDVGVREKAHQKTGGFFGYGTQNFLTTQMKLKSESAKIPCSPNGVGQFLLVGGSSIDFCLGKRYQTTLSLKMLTK